MVTQYDGVRYGDYSAQIPILNENQEFDVYSTFHLGFPFQNTNLWTANSTNQTDCGKVSFLHLLYSVFIWQFLIDKPNITVPPAPVRAFDAGSINLGSN